MNTPSASQDLFQLEHDLFFQTYKRLPIDIDRGEGVFLYDRSGKQYLDFFGGLAVNSLGNAHPGIVAAITAQAEKYHHLSNFFVQESQVKLVEHLLSLTGFKRAFLTNSGTEALEGAVKLARMWGGPKGKKRIIGFSNAFHGRTMSALSLMDKEKYRKGYEPFLPGCESLPYNDPAALERAVSDDVLALILEPIQGEGGVVPASPEFAAAVNHAQEKNGLLVIADEVQSGVGRTGRFFAFEHLGLKPDIVMMAKALGGGLPLGALLGNERVADVFTFGVHGTTFGGNPIACEAGRVVLREVSTGGLMERATRIGHILHRIGDGLRKDFPKLVKETRGYGCMIGINLSIESQPIADALLTRGILVNSTSVTVLRLLPPLILEEEHCLTFERELRTILQGYA